MNYKGRVVVIVNVISDIAALIYIILLRRYNEILYEIQSQYSDKLLKALNVVKEPDYYTYFLLGIIFAGLLIWNSVWDYRSRADMGISTIILILVNCCFLIALIVVYSNPIFTSMITLLTFAGTLMALNR